MSMIYKNMQKGIKPFHCTFLSSHGPSLILSLLSIIKGRKKEVLFPRLHFSQLSVCLPYETTGPQHFNRGEANRKLNLIGQCEFKWKLHFSWFKTIEIRYNLNWEISVELIIILFLLTGAQNAKRCKVQHDEICNIN